jgi:hypothetical protein
VRRITTSGRDLPKNSKAIIDEFISACANQIRKYKLDRNCLANMDETSVNLDSFCKIFNKLHSQILRNYLFFANYTFDTKEKRPYPTAF